MKPLYQIFCEGYHITENTTRWVNEDYPPDYIEMRTTTSDVAKREGWTTTRNKKFSRTGDIVWLCPDCTKRWDEEKRTRKENLLESKISLKEKYMKDKDRLWIINNALPSLHEKFMKWEPTNEDWKRWNEI